MMKICLYLPTFILILSFVNHVTAKPNDAGQFLVSENKNKISK
jgi:hypothetical protein